MALSSGTRLGPYEIVAPIGAGGMGEVFKARDTRLDRSVAVKVLPRDVSADPDRRARFEREAKTIAGLNHPHICTLHDVGCDVPTGQAGRRLGSPKPIGEGGGAEGGPDGLAVDYLVMELLSGETLADRLRKGPLPLEQALSVATEIADALAAAHRQGVTHRDLKPANVMLTKTGAKLLDFGLAKLTGHGERPAAASLASAPTEMRPLTSEGTIVGTLQYMAPEQVEGKPADARTDLWALGAIVYEMVTGKRAFEGASAASLVAAVMSSEPSAPSSLRPMTPPALDAMVKRCLTKDPDARWQSAQDLAMALSWMAIPEAAIPGANAAIQSRQRRAVAWLSAATALLAALSAWGWFRPTETAERRPALHFPLWVGNAPLATNRWGAATALSRDGTKVAYRTERGWQLLDLAAGASRTITEEFQGNHAVFSPRGDTLLTRQGGWAGQLVTISVSTGAATLLRSDVTGGEMHWAEDGWIYYGRQFGIARIRERDRLVEDLLVPDLTRDNWLACNPVPLPRGRSVIFTRRHRPFSDHSRDEVCLLDLGTKAVRPLVKGQQAWYLPDGYLLWARAGGTVFAARFDASAAIAAEEPSKVLDGVHMLGTMYGATMFKLSPGGTLLYGRSGPPKDDELVVTDRTGAVRRVVPGWGGSIQSAAVSPDGRRVAASVYRGGGPPNVWMQDLTTQQTWRVSYGELLDYNPEFLPFDRGIAYVSPRNGGNWDLWKAPFGRVHEEERVLDLSGDIRTASVAAEGWAVLCEAAPDGQLDIRAYRTVTGAAIEIAATGAAETMPAVTPDARWVAYQSDESGRNEVYARSFQTEGKGRQVSTAGGRGPCWSPSGRELLYVNGRNEVVSVRVDGAGSPLRQPETVLFPLRGFAWGRMVLPGDQGFVLINPKPNDASLELVLVRNWDDELRAKMPGK